jgi:hypothetical protein
MLTMNLILNKKLTIIIPITALIGWYIGKYMYHPYYYIMYHIPERLNPFVKKWNYPQTLQEEEDFYQKLNDDYYARLKENMK